MRRLVLAALLTAAALLAGCGSSATPASSRPPQSATLILDFTPNAVHTGIYAAIARGYDRESGVLIHVVVPSASTDSISLLETGRVDFAILDIHDLAIARERGQDIVGVMAIVERPLSAVIASPGITSPRMLAGGGKLVGITGVPSDTAVLRSVVSGSGGDPQRLRTITIGYDAVADLLAGRVAAATAFWNDEGITLQQRRPGFHIFRVEDYGAPPYPELVLCTLGSTVRSDPRLTQSVVTALVRGYQATLANPAAGAASLESLVPGLDPKLVATQLDALLPAFRSRDGQVADLDLASLEPWARWEARFGIVSRPPDVGTMFDPTFVDNAASRPRG